MLCLVLVNLTVFTIVSICKLSISTVYVISVKPLVSGTMFLIIKWNNINGQAYDNNIRFFVLLMYGQCSCFCLLTPLAKVRFRLKAKAISPTSYNNSNIHWYLTMQCLKSYNSNDMNNNSYDILHHSLWINMYHLAFWCRYVPERDGSITRVSRHHGNRQSKSCC